MRPKIFLSSLVLCIVLSLPLSVRSKPDDRTGSSPGGGSSSSPFEVNPNYIPPSYLAKRDSRQSVRLENIDDRGRVVAPRGNNKYYIEAQTLSFENSPVSDVSGLCGHQQQQDKRNLSLASFVRQSVENAYKNTGSPALANTAAACIAVYVLWQIPSPQMNRLLRLYFVCGARNFLPRTSPLRSVTSIVLSSVSHSGLLHLAFNLLALLSIGPSVRGMMTSSAGPAIRYQSGSHFGIATSSTNTWPMWPLLFGAAVTGSAFFLCLDRGHDGALGLSGVTLALLAVYSRFVPDRVLQILVGGVVPIGLPAKRLVSLMIIWSVVGLALEARGLHSAQVAHSTHLGGLLFGLVYFEAWSRRSQLRVLVHQARTGISNFKFRHER